MLRKVYANMPWFSGFKVYLFHHHTIVQSPPAFSLRIKNMCESVFLTYKSVHMVFKIVLWDSSSVPTDSHFKMNHLLSIFTFQK